MNINKEGLTHEQWAKYIQNTHQSFTDIAYACLNIPISELDHYKSVYKNIGIEKSDFDIRIDIIKNRYFNSRCQQCHKCDSIMKLTRCPKCKLAFFCSDKCKNENSKDHENYCCNNNFVYIEKEDLYRPVIMERPDKESDKK